MCEVMLLRSFAWQTLRYEFMLGSSVIVFITLIFINTTIIYDNVIQNILNVFEAA